MCWRAEKDSCRIGLPYSKKKCVERPVFSSQAEQIDMIPESDHDSYETASEGDDEIFGRKSSSRDC